MTKKHYGTCILIFMLAMALVTGCSGQKKEESVDKQETAEIFSKPLEEILGALYEKVEDKDTREFLQGFGSGEITKENAAYFIGSEEVAFTEGIYSEPLMSSIACSVCLIRLEEGADIEQQEELIESKVDPRKWICVEAEEIETETIGDVLLLAMGSETDVEQITDAFEALNK